jgi:hypothetical protein
MRNSSLRRLIDKFSRLAEDDDVHFVHLLAERSGGVALAETRAPSSVLKAGNPALRCCWATCPNLRVRHELRRPATDLRRSPACREQYICQRKSSRRHEPAETDCEHLTVGSLRIFGPLPSNRRRLGGQAQAFFEWVKK